MAQPSAVMPQRLSAMGSNALLARLARLTAVLFEKSSDSVKGLDRTHLVDGPFFFFHSMLCIFSQAVAPQAAKLSLYTAPKAHHRPKCVLCS